MTASPTVGLPESAPAEAPPGGEPTVPASWHALAALLRGRRVAALTGAGCSTASGIPDYGGLGRPPRGRKPIVHDEFLRRFDVRQRYWARATLGWARFSQAAPNPAHRALAEMEQVGWLGHLVTQNVDRLHHAAGSCAVTELHGALADVICLDCGEVSSRAALQTRLLAANPAWQARLDEVLHAPDGDAEAEQEAVGGFEVVPCSGCGGRLKPNVVLFGGTVAESVVHAAHDAIAAADVLLVVGSSLAVYSGWRFVRAALERAQPVAIVNLGATRADDHPVLKVSSAAADVLPWLVNEEVGARGARRAP